MHSSEFGVKVKVEECRAHARCHPILMQSDSYSVGILQQQESYSGLATYSKGVQSACAAPIQSSMQSDSYNTVGIWSSGLATYMWGDLLHMSDSNSTVGIPSSSWNLYYLSLISKGLPFNPQCNRIPTIGDQHVARILLQYAPWQGCQESWTGLALSKGVYALPSYPQCSRTPTVEDPGTAVEILSSSGLATYINLILSRAQCNPIHTEGLFC